MTRHVPMRRAFTLLELLVSIGLITLLISMLLPAIQRARAAIDAITCRNNLRQMGIAMHMYHQDHGKFPPGYYRYLLGLSVSDAGGVSPMSLASRIRIFDRPGPPPVQPISHRPGWGWGAYLLPYLEQDNLHKQIDFESAVEGPSNDNIRTTRLRLYTCPSDSETGVFTILTELTSHPLADAATNSYAACYGWGGLLGTQPGAGNGVFYRNSRVRFADVIDGTSNTMAIGERGAFFAKTPWAGVLTSGSVRVTPGAPVFKSIVEPAPVMVLARVGSKKLNDPGCEPYDFFTPHRQVGHFLFVDGSVQNLRTTTDVKVLGAIATRAGGESFSHDEF